MLSVIFNKFNLMRLNKIRQFLFTSNKSDLSYGPIAAVGITLLTYFVSQIAAEVLVFIGFGVIMGWVYQEFVKWIDNNPLSQFLLDLAVELISLGLIYKYLKNKQVRWSQVAISKIKINYGFLKQITLVGLAYFSTLIIVFLLIKDLPGIDLEQKQEIGFSTNLSGPVLLLPFISLVLLAPLTEEILIRGFLYSGIANKFKQVPAAIIVSILFASAHLQIGSGAPLLWTAAIDTFILSLFLIYLRIKQKSLIGPIILHSLKNAVAFYALFIK